MRGDLSDNRLEEIFAELSASDATGALHLEGATGPAKVFFREGDVYYASSPAPRAQLGARLVGAGFIDDDELDRALTVQDQGPTRTKLGAILVDQAMVRRDVIRVFVQEQILDAVFDLARWDDGTFEFFRGDAVAEDLPVQIPTRPLLMEVRRRLSEWEDIRAVIPSLDAVPDFVRGGSTTQAALEPDEFTLLTSVDGQRSVRELAHDLGYSQFDAARLIYGLSLLGVIGVPNGEVDAAPVERSAEPARERPAPEPEAEPAPEAEPEAEVERAPEAEPEPEAERAPEAETGPPADEPEEVDVGRALEEALFGYGYDEEPAADLEEPAADLEDVAPEPATETSAAADVPPAGADDLEPEVWSASIDADETATADADVAPEPTVEHPPQQPVGERTPPEARDEEPDQVRDELLALVDELQDVSPDLDEDVEDGAEVIDVDEPPAAVEPSAPDESPRPEEARPAAQPTEERPARQERGDVSELLRELSRLAGGGPEPVAPSPDEPGARDEPGEPDDTAESAEEPDEPPEPEPPPDAKKDEDKRSTFRRLFGSR